MTLRRTLPRGVWSLVLSVALCATFSAFARMGAGRPRGERPRRASRARERQGWRRLASGRVEVAANHREEPERHRRGRASVRGPRLDGDQHRGHGRLHEGISRTDGELRLRSAQHSRMAAGPGPCATRQRHTAGLLRRDQVHGAKRRNNRRGRTGVARRVRRNRRGRHDHVGQRGRLMDTGAGLPGRYGRVHRHRFALSHRVQLPRHQQRHQRRHRARLADHGGSHGQRQRRHLAGHRLLSRRLHRLQPHADGLPRLGRRRDDDRRGGRPGPGRQRRAAHGLERLLGDELRRSRRVPRRDRGLHSQRRREPLRHLPGGPRRGRPDQGHV